MPKNQRPQVVIDGMIGPVEARRHQARVLRVGTVARDTTEVVFQILDSDFSFHPGQYIWVRLPRLDVPDSRGPQRAFSIASAPNQERTISIFYRNSTSGFKRTLNLMAGKTVEIDGPFGSAFVIEADNDRPIIMLAGGTGASPFLSLIGAAYRQTRSSVPSMVLCRYEHSIDRAPYINELEAITAARQQLVARTYAGDFSWSHVAPYVHQNQRPRWLVSGTQGFVEAVAWALEQHGIQSEDIQYEQFHPQNKNATSLRRLLLHLRHSDVGRKNLLDQTSQHVVLINRIFPPLVGLAGFISLALGVWYFSTGHSSYLNFIASAVMVVILALWPLKKLQPQLINSILLFTFGFMLVFAYTGAADETGILWLGLFPVLAALIKPRRVWAWGSAFIVAMLIITLGRGYGFLHPVYEVETYASSTAYQLLITLMVGFFMRSFVRMESSLIWSIEQEQVFHQAIDSSTNHVIITDENGCVLYANQSAQNITGYSLSEMVGNTPRLWGGLMTPDTYKNIWRTKTTGRPFETEIINRRKNGELYTAIAHISPILDRHRTVIGYIGTEEDITNMKAAEASLARLAVIVRDSDDAIYTKDSSGVITTWNDGARKMYGYTGKEIIGRPADLLAPADRPDEVNDFLRHVHQGVAVDRVQTVRKRKDGSLVDVSISETPLHSTDGKVIGTSTIARDITKEKLVDKAKTEFVSLASHQLRTPLTAINWYTEMLLAGDAGKLSKGQKEYLSEIIHGSRRMVTLVNSLLNTSRIDLGTFAVEPEPSDLSAIVQAQLKEQFPSTIAKKLKIVTSFEPSIPSIMLDPKLMSIVVQNLISNAIKYTPEKGTITIALAKNDTSIILSVADTGYGIPLSQQDKIFTKLFRADNVRELVTDGTGLGLYIVKAVIEQSGGTIGFTSQEHAGTTFTITLPLSGMKAKAGVRGLS